MLVWIPIRVRIREPTKMLDRNTVRELSLARSTPVIRDGNETLKSTLMVAIFHHGIERSKGTRLVENSSESIAILKALSWHPAASALDLSYFPRLRTDARSSELTGRPWFPSSPKSSLESLHGERRGSLGSARITAPAIATQSAYGRYRGQRMLHQPDTQAT